MSFHHIDADAWKIVDPIIQGTGKGILSGNYDYFLVFSEFPSRLKRIWVKFMLNATISIVKSSIGYAGVTGH